ncbi:hypothetical protein U1Q18_010422 [Sarracenia purpurea var. burkii]
MITLSLSSPQSFSVCNKSLISLKSPPHENRLLHNTQHWSLFRFNSLRESSNCKELMMTMMKKKKFRGFNPVCYSTPLGPPSLQWISTVCTAVLVLAKGTAIQKSFLVPLFVLQAPQSIISWIKSEYGIWTAFLTLLVRLFFFIPGELELPFQMLLLAIVAPYQVTNLRGTQGGVILSLLIAGYLAFQHFSRAGSLRKACDQGSIIATLAIICVFSVPGLLLTQL